MKFEELRQNEWDLSYGGGGNILFYPHEEIIRFVNKYVRKRTGVLSFENIMKLSPKDWKSFKSLDLGCGIGRHVKYLEECGLNPYGIDLSGEAIRLGKEWISFVGKNELSERLLVGSVTELPFEDETFMIIVSHGVLDSMPREIAIKGMSEAVRCLRSNGMMYLDLVMDANSDIDKEEIQLDGMEKDTVQSYFTFNSMKKLFGNLVSILELKVVKWCDENDVCFNKRAHIVLRKV